jgi:hypothetical protein
MWIPRRPPVQTGLRDIVYKFIPNENIEDFAAWAFGENYGDLLEIIEFAYAWNRLHEDIFKVEMESPIVHDVHKMTQLYLIHKDSNEKIGLSD